jgi:hypothetical protein
MIAAVRLAPWPPCGAISAAPLPIGPGFCPKHGLPQLVLQQPQAVFAFRVLTALSELVSGQGSGVMLFNGPVCCLLGDAAMERIHHSIPAVWGLRN